MQSLKGTGVALVTPFKADLTVDTDALGALVEYVIQGNVEYIVVLGTTAESATLNQQEKQLVKQTVIEVNNKRLPLVLGVGGNDTAAVVAELSDENLAGFDAILSVSPYYNKPTQKGIYEHFKQIALHSPVPVILYNVPSRTGSNMEASTSIALANDFKNIVAIKEAKGCMVQAMELIRQNTREDFLIISGDDTLALPMTLAGGSGVISVIGQGLPAKFSELIRLGLNKNVEEAFALHYDFMPIIDSIFEQGNPAGIKEILFQAGVCQTNLRLPLVNVDEQLAAKLKEQYIALK